MLAGLAIATPGALAAGPPSAGREPARATAEADVRGLEARIAAGAARLGLSPTLPGPMPRNPRALADRARALGHVAAFLDGRREVVRSRMRPPPRPARAHDLPGRAGVAVECRRLGISPPSGHGGPAGTAARARWEDVRTWLRARREVLREIEEPLVRPADGIRTSPFGPRWGRAHEGVDIGGASGAPIHAAASGVVVAAGWNGGYGRLVVIRHAGDLTTAYAHMSAITTAVGRPVARGEVIGRMGSTGHSTGTHLHFETRHGGRAVDPEPYLRYAPAATPGTGRRPVAGHLLVPLEGP